MNKFEQLNKEEKIITLCLFAIKTECNEYNISTILHSFLQTDEDVKLKYIEKAKDFIKLKNLFVNNSDILSLYSNKI